MRFTDIKIIDPIMSICVAIFILYHALKGLKKIMDLFLEKTPGSIQIDEIREHLLKIENVIDVHHIHIWSIDGVNNYATMHIVTNLKDTKKLKAEIKEEMEEHGVNHTTVEIEDENEQCDEFECNLKFKEHSHAHHHHHH